MPICRLNWMASDDVAGNSARTVPAGVVPMLKFTGAGVDCLIWRLILASSVVALWVLNRLAATIFLSPAMRTCLYDLQGG